MNSLMRRGSLFDDFLRDVAPSYYVKPLHGDPLPSPSSIKIDVKENDAAYTVQAVVPGVNKEDIQISLDGNVATVSAEVKQQDSDSKNEKSLHTERYYGAVSRSFQLLQEFDQNSSKAKYDNGAITLTLAKKTGGSPRRLVID